MADGSSDYVRFHRSRVKGDDFVIEPQNAALLVIDMQYSCASRTHGAGRISKERGEGESVEYRWSRIENLVVPNIGKLLGFFRANGLRVIYVTVGSQMPDYSDIFPHRRPYVQMVGNTVGNREHEVLDEIKPLPGECVINKLTRSAFASSNIDIVLRAMGIEYLIFTGNSTGGCVEGTYRSAFDRGYRCVVVEDACADWTEKNHNDAIAGFRGKVTTTNAIVREFSDALAVSI